LYKSEQIRNWIEAVENTLQKQKSDAILCLLRRTFNKNDYCSKYKSVVTTVIVTTVYRKIVAFGGWSME
jgi:hypothetical protein